MNEVWTPQSRIAVTGLTLLRVTAGIIFAAHGWQKLSDFAMWQEHISGMGLPAPQVLAPLAVAGELGGGLGLALGLLTRLAAFGAACVMAVAIATVHITHGLFAQNNGFEYPLLLGMTALYFVLRGAGPVSIDALWGKSRERVWVEHGPYRHHHEQPSH